jgi:GH3 auxin-responsive promoter
LHELRKTDYGYRYKTAKVRNPEEFADACPVIDYETIRDDIQKMMNGGENILWPGKVYWYAKSSGTTSDRSKFIPISDEILFENHVASSWDAMSILYSNRPEARNFDGKNLLMGGSLCPYSDKVMTGDVSAILLNRMPALGRPFYTPDFETALLPDWEEKIERIAHQCIKEDVVMFGGVPTWTIVLFKRILEITGKNNIVEVWPNVKTYFHGGVGFDPYMAQFKEFLPIPDMEYYEVYNASEGYFAVQDRLNEKGMLLLLDNHIYYEFIHSSEMNSENPKVLNLQDVELNNDYCIVITNSSGLWRYKPGDVVRFVSLMPYRIMISGRTKHYINVFGEEVMVHNTDKALNMACSEANCNVKDYTVAPIFMAEGQKGGHEWFIEFNKAPEDLTLFANLLDNFLRSINSDYDAKRTKDMALVNLKVNAVATGSFDNWLAHKGKLGGQSKIPRLSNDRKFVTDFMAFLGQSDL